MNVSGLQRLLGERLPDLACGGAQGARFSGRRGSEPTPIITLTTYYCMERKHGFRGYHSIRVRKVPPPPSGWPGTSLGQETAGSGTETTRLPVTNEACERLRKDQELTS